MDSQDTSTPEPKPAWGKREKQDGYPPKRFHCLEHHCADVAMCFAELVQDPVLHHRFERAMGGGQFCAITKARLAVIAFFHDFAKLNSGFQFKVHDRNVLPPNPPPRAGHIKEACFFFQQRDLCETLGLYELVSEWGNSVEPLLRAALSHHGRPIVCDHTGSGPAQIWQPFDDYDPRAIAALLRERVRAWFPEAFQQGTHLPEPGEAPALAHLFAGIVALADHIGSDEKAFPMEPRPDPDYIKKARKRAQNILQKRGFFRAQRPAQAKPVDFPTMFCHTHLRPLQKAVDDASLDHPLLILESETGSGKTEAAIIRFANLWRKGLVDGLYFAVPTRAAATQLHRRVNKSLVRLFAGSMEIETVLAIPGYIVAGNNEGKPIVDYKVTWEDNPDQAKKDARWSGESALHFLSATAAVGTIDQALLGSLKVKWAHLRGASLARSLLVVDEVHASDEYMTALLRSLLRDHLAIGGHAMLMSATLGAAARIRLSSCAASSRHDLLPPIEETEKAPYPAITLADGRSGSSPEIHSIDSSDTGKKVRMETRECIGNASQIAELAHSCAQEGAKVLVIRNTVGAAQAVFKELLEHGKDKLLFSVNGVPTLHHSRFAAEDRKLMDDAVENELGKDRKNDNGLIVVGTQTLEQSLDIDADLLITDLCPVDVLLQRIGRLHRHGDRERPDMFSEPRCIVLTPENGLEDGLKGGLLRYGLGQPRNGGGIYPNLLIIRQTQQLIERHDIWNIPDMNRMLVEQATHPDVLREQAQKLGEEWKTSEEKTYGGQAAKENIAKKHCLDRRVPYDDTLEFPDQEMNIRTRLSEEGRRIKLEEGRPGPFGQPVKTFNLPQHLFLRGNDKLPPDIFEDVRTEKTDDGLRLYLGDYIFSYDRTGIRRQEKEM